MTAPRRRWFRFSLRTLFVVVTVLGCWLGWQVNWIHERRLARIAHGIETDWSETFPPTSVNAPFPLNWLGEPGQQIVFLKPNWGAAEQERIRRLFPEATADYVPDQ